jgi:hypothetical protein
METSYRHVSAFFAAILLVALIGFFKSYLSLLPDFPGINSIQHFHGLMMLLWLGMLITQPLLIRYKRVDLHKKLGKVSYLLVPLIVASFFLIGRMGYQRDASLLPTEENIGFLALTLPDMVGFSLLYILAMVHKNNPPLHMRYIIGTSLLLISPGLGRIVLNYADASLPTAAEVSHLTAIAIALLLVAYDVHNRRPYKPFAVTFFTLSLMHLCWEFRLTPLWQTLAGQFASTFF